jgi:copper chaperone
VSKEASPRQGTIQYIDPNFFERYAMNHEFTVTGMTCGHCEKAVTKAVQKQDPDAQVLIRRDQNLVQVQSTKERETLRQAIVEEGYAVAP